VVVHEYCNALGFGLAFGVWTSDMNGLGWNGICMHNVFMICLELDGADGEWSGFRDALLRVV